MTKEFIPYWLALKLKELGFDEPCFAVYEPQEIGIMFRWVQDQKVVSNKAIGYIIAPLYQQAFRWLRETHNIDVDVVRDSEVHYQDETRWVVKTSNWNDIQVKNLSIAELKFPNHSHHIDFKSYKEALEKGLEEGLKFIENEKI
jgi:hypothetical protein